ncbi:sensor histidine kinase [Demequina lutea]|uniref:Sensor-like histidine kinase SenX3 n=1 Tax=Demequina lutea TaxID=431489 RepID=A0A7Z0CH68_9MICO|nr:ATP-binding protein [Demequina lutea]NYI40529.1 two-component system sensor histidine kinase SenX3 [Demequina lutea]
MTPLAWLVASLAFGLGVIVGALALRRRAKKEVVARMLVPHRTRQIVAALQSGAIVVRRDRRAGYSNHTAAALGLARPDGALHEAVADLAEKAWATGEVVEEDVEVRRGVLGSVSIVHVRLTPIDDELVFAVANDNTEQRAAEATRREFAVNVSHELKTPIGALSLLAETIESASDDPVMVREFAVKMRREARRLTKLIQEIIQISRLQGGESVLDHDQVDVAGVVHEAFEGAALAAEAKRISLVADLRERPHVLGDRDLLVMAVRNLVDNAVSYSDPGARVTASVTCKDDIVSIAVLDQGIGIDAQDQERIFERFYRADPARARDTGGTGLGLSIVKHVALQHGGAVTVWSQPSVGSTFTLSLQRFEESE